MNEARIRFRFNEESATAAAALLLHREAGRMPYLRLMKLMYLAERECLRRFGRPMIGDQYVAMEHGPVLSTVLDLIRGTPGTESSVWAASITEPADYQVGLKGTPNWSALSDAEIEILENVSQFYREFDRWRLRDFTHTLPEWIDPGKSSEVIPPETILRAVGKSDEEIEEIRQRSTEHRHFEKLFGECRGDAAARPDVR